jgi:hypothetical protein
MVGGSPKVNNSRGPMVNVINAISGGSNEPMHEMKRQRKDYLRAVNHVCEGKHFRTTWSHIPITFNKADLKLKHFLHNDPWSLERTLARTRYTSSGMMWEEFWWTQEAPQMSLLGGASSRWVP